MMAFHDLSKRLVLTVLSLTATSLLLAFSSFPVVIVVILFFLICLTGIAIWEYNRLVGLSLDRKMRRLVMLLGAFIVFSFFCASQSGRFFLAPVAVLIGSGILLFLIRFRQIEGAATLIAKAFFGLCYIAVPMGLLFLILYPQWIAAGGRDGRLYLGYLIIVTKGADIGAYFGGRIWGKTKLASKLSPGKTVEGAITGLGVSVGISFCCYLIGYLLPGFQITFGQSFVLGILLGGIGQIGDLAESLLKRDAGVKDSNRLPGFGGVLDLLDSLLFTTPVFYLFFAMIQT